MARCPALAAGLEIRTSRLVRRITHGPDGVRVETEAIAATPGCGLACHAPRGEGGSTETHAADLCLVTVPLGVLKAGTIVFDPPLPAAKTAAISRMGMGTLNKIALRFPATF